MPGAPLLDFGCFEGRLLAQYRRRGYRAEGADFNAAVTVARETGLPVHFGYPQGSSFAVVVLCGVVQHLSDPESELRALRVRLALSGRLKLSCPSRNSLFRRVFGASWANWHIPFHRHVFDASTLGSLLADAGFEVVRARTISPSADLMRSTLVATGLQTNTKTPHPYLALPLVLANAFLLKPLILAINLSGRGDSLAVEARPVAADTLWGGFQ